MCYVLKGFSESVGPWLGEQFNLTHICVLNVKANQWPYMYRESAKKERERERERACGCEAPQHVLGIMKTGLK